MLRLDCQHHFRLNCSETTAEMELERRRERATSRTELLRSDPVAPPVVPAEENFNQIDTGTSATQAGTPEPCPLKKPHRPLSANTLATQLLADQVGPIGTTRSKIGALQGRRLASWWRMKGRTWPRSWRRRFCVLKGLELSWWRTDQNSETTEVLADKTMNIGGCTCVVVHDASGYRLTFIPPAENAAPLQLGE